MQFANWCGSWKDASGTKNFVLQALQSREMDVGRKFPGGAVISHNGYNKRFVEV